MSEDKERKENAEDNKTTPDDNMGLNGHILIPIKKQVKNLLINVMLFITVTWLHFRSTNKQSRVAFVHYMAFGNGATSVDTAGIVIKHQSQKDESEQFIQ